MTDASPSTAATLDPPGSIAVIGAGPLGIEAALYGRYLGYNVTLFEARAVASSLVPDRDQPIPMLPDRCLSPLAASALQAQDGGGREKRSPITIGEWIDDVWVPLVETDLLRGRLRCPCRVTAIDFCDPEPEAIDSDDDANEDPPDQASGDGESIPPDFRLSLAEEEPADFEAVVLATGAAGKRDGTLGIEHSFAPGTEYFFAIGANVHGDGDGDGEAKFWSGLKEIVALYASLAGRTELDLYRPLRG